MDGGTWTALPCMTQLLSCILQEVSYEESQKYKEGKYIIEKQKVIKVRCLWFSVCDFG